MASAVSAISVSIVVVVIVVVSVALLCMSIVANRRPLSTLPIGVAESGFVADGDQGDDDESAAHCWSPFGVVD